MWLCHTYNDIHYLVIKFITDICCPLGQIHLVVNSRTGQTLEHLMYYRFVTHVLLLGYLYCPNKGFMPNFVLCFTIISFWHRPSTVSYLFVRGNYFLPDQLPGKHTGHKAASRHCGLINLFLQFSFILPHIIRRHKYHSWTCSDSLQVFFIVHPSHRHDSTHPRLDK